MAASAMSPPAPLQKNAVDTPSARRMAPTMKAPMGKTPPVSRNVEPHHPAAELARRLGLQARIAARHHHDPEEARDEEERHRRPEVTGRPRGTRGAERDGGDGEDAGERELPAGTHREGARHRSHAERGLRKPKPSAPRWSTWRARSGTYTLKLKTQRLTTATSPSTTRITGRFRRVLNACGDLLASWRRPCSVRGRPWAFSLKRTTIIAAKPSAVQAEGGRHAEARDEDAATAGPTMRAALNEAELSATALPRSSRPTSSTTKSGAPAGRPR